MCAFADMTGKRFGKLSVIRLISHDKQQNAVWECLCDCGTKKNIRGYNLRNGSIKSCGCLQREAVGNIKRTHGMYNTKLYHVWQAMKSRCFNPKNKRFKDYGFRGITVADTWMDFEKFYEWAKQSGYKEGLSIDRINNNGNYEPSNCRWATSGEQAINKRNNIKIKFRGTEKTLSEWCADFGLKYGTAKSRILRGWDIETAFLKPIQKRTR